MACNTQLPYIASYTNHGARPVPKLRFMLDYPVRQRNVEIANNVRALRCWITPKQDVKDWATHV